jgi:hypothetical protein
LADLPYAKVRKPMKEQAVLISVLRLFEIRPYGVRHEVLIDLKKQQGNEAISSVKLSGILDSLIALGLLTVHRIHGKAEICEISDSGRRIIGAAHKGETPSELIARVVRKEAGK